MNTVRSWPRLTETLPHAANPQLCGNCGIHDNTKLVHIWIEHDLNDKPERKFIALCEKCSDKIIESHPRLYAQVGPNTPIPGVMLICIDCKFRDGLDCKSPEAKFNGGKGFSVKAAKPITYHIDGTHKGKRWSRWGNHYSIAPKSCTGKQPL